MGFGHRVYKNYDPRARQMQKLAHEINNALGVQYVHYDAYCTLHYTCVSASDHRLMHGAPQQHCSIAIALVPSIH